MEGCVENNGWMIEGIDKDDSTATALPEEVRIRGFKINKMDQLQQSYSEPGKFCLKP